MARTVESHQQRKRVIDAGVGVNQQRNGIVHSVLSGVGETGGGADPARDQQIRLFRIPLH
jgi:hypothetical protein